MFGSGREALPENPRVVGGPNQMSRKHCLMSGSGRETLPDVWEWSGDPPGCPGVVGRPSQMSGSGRETPRMSGSGWEVFSDVR